MQYFDREAGADLKAAFDDLVSDWAAIEEKTMFGCPSYTAGGTLFAVLVTDGVALTRLPESQRDSIAEVFETGPFQAGERTVTKWVQVTVDDAERLRDLSPYVTMSYEEALAESATD